MERIASYAAAGLCLSASPSDLAEIASAARADGSLDELSGRLKTSEIGNGLALALERIEALAAI